MSVEVTRRPGDPVPMLLYASCKSDAHPRRRQRLQCSWTSNLELSADEPKTAGLSYSISDSRWCFYFANVAKAQREPPSPLEILLLSCLRTSL